MRKVLLLPLVGVVVLGAAGGGYYFMRSKDSLRQGSVAFQQGDYRRAQIEFRNAVRTHPQSGDAHFNLALVESRLGDPVAAEKDLREAITDGFDPLLARPALAQSLLDQNRFRDILTEFPPPSSPPEYVARIQMARAVAQLGLHDLQKAQEAITAAQTQAPKLVDAVVVAAQIAMAQRDTAGAEKKVDQAIAMDPHASQALAIKGELLAARGDREGAIKSLDSALAVNPGFTAARLTRANLLVSSNRDADAKKDIDAVLSGSPRNVLGLYFRGVLAVRAGDWASADQSFTLISQFLPNFPRGLYLAAMVKANLGQMEQAADFANRFASRNPNDIEGTKLQARVAIMDKRYDQAQDLLNRAASSGKADAETLDLLGRTYVLAGQPQQAVVSFQKASGMAPDNADILARLASVRMNTGDASGATTDYERSLQLAPKNTANGEALVIAALTAGDIPKAQAALAKLRTEQGDSETVGILSGAIKTAQGDLDGARRDFEGVLKTFPKSIPAKLNLARLAAMQGRVADSEQLFTNVLNQDPANEAALQAMISVMLSAGKTGDAIALVQKARDANPSNAVLTASQADLYTRQNEGDKALALLDKQPKEQINLPMLLGARARAQVAMNRQDDAKDTYRKILANNPGDLDARSVLTQLLLTTNDVDGARKVITDGLKLAPKNFGMLETLTRLELRTKGLEPALALADQLAKDPTHQPDSLLLKGDLYVYNRNYDKAADSFKAEYQSKPSSVLAIRLANAQNASGHPDQAIATLTDWTAKTPNDLEASQQLGMLDLQVKDNDKAQALFENIVAHAPRDALALNNLAWIYAEKKDPRARELGQRAFSIAPTPEIADTYGWALTSAGDAAAAVPLLRQAASRLGNNPSVQYHLGTALVASGQRDEAIRALTVATSSAADFPEKAAAQKALQDLQAAK